MLPILFSINSLNFYILGFLLGVGYFIGAFIIWRRLKDLGIKEELIIDLIISLGLTGLFVSRVFYIIQNFDKFTFLPLTWIDFSRYPGFSFTGGVVGILLALVRFSKKQKWDYWQIGDEITFGILPFLILVQVGSFLDGSGQGRPTSLPWGIYFPGSLLRRHPLSLFSAALIFFIWVFLLKIERQWRIWEWYKSKANGFILLVFLSLLSLSIFLLAFWRDSRVYFYWLEVILSAIGSVGALIIFYLRSGRSQNNYGKEKRQK